MSDQNFTGIKSSGPGTFWLIGFRLDPNFSYPDFYTVVREDPAYWPITYKDQIILFQEAKTAQDALDFYIRHSRLPSSSVTDTPTMVLDFAQALYVLSKASRDETSCVLNIINSLLDMLKAVSIELPPLYHSDLYLLADHLTFSKEFGSFINDQQLNRGEIIEALQWALGAVLTKSMFFPKPDINSQ